MLKILLLIFSFSVFSQELPYFCSNQLDKIPTQAGGRVKPLYVHAKETLKFISGKTKLGNYDTTTTFCLISLQAMGLTNDINVPIKVDHVDVRKLMGLDIDAKTINAETALTKTADLRMAIMKEKLNNAYKKELNKVFSRIETYKSISTGVAWTLPEFNENKVSWIPLTNFLTEEKVELRKKTTATPFKDIFESMKREYDSTISDDYLLEYTYVRSNIFSWAMLLALLAIISLTLFKKLTVGAVFTILCVVTQLIGMTMRVYISGRAPITNMYETVMFSGLGCLLIAIFITYFRKDKIFIIAGLGYNILCLLMMSFANNMLNPSINPLVPVLRDNFWLSTHVTTIILSYAALALSWMLANMVLYKKAFGSLSKSDNTYYVDLIYTCIKFGVTLLAAGIILGGVWADYSWGRFWGWDPKETWSLIVFLIYMAILHGKYTNWITNDRFVPLIAGAFLSVMMAWFGVNYILASGLHSYGFSQGGAMFLGTFFVTQIAVLFIAKLKSPRIIT